MKKENVDFTVLFLRRFRRIFAETILLLENALSKEDYALEITALSVPFLFMSI